MYGCYDPKNVWKYTFKCDGCVKRVSPNSGYRTTHGGSPGYLFFCPDCPHVTFAYRFDKEQSLLEDTL